VIGLGGFQSGKRDLGSNNRDEHHARPPWVARARSLGWAPVARSPERLPTWPASAAVVDSTRFRTIASAAVRARAAKPASTRLERPQREASVSRSPPARPSVSARRSEPGAEGRPRAVGGRSVSPAPRGAVVPTIRSTAAKRSAATCAARVSAYATNVRVGEAGAGSVGRRQGAVGTGEPTETRSAIAAISAVRPAGASASVAGSSRAVKTADCCAPTVASVWGRVRPAPPIRIAAAGTAAARGAPNLPRPRLQRRLGRPGRRPGPRRPQRPRRRASPANHKRAGPAPARVSRVVARSSSSVGSGRGAQPGASANRPRFPAETGLSTLAKDATTATPSAGTGAARIARSRRAAAMAR
jgi:hypothetical protein